VVGAAQWQAYQARFVYAVEVDGEFLGYVPSREAWEEAAREAQDCAESRTGLVLALDSAVRLTRTLPVEGMEILAGKVLLDACCSRLSFVGEAWAVSVDGADVVYLRTEAEARDVVRSLVEDYRQALLEKGDTRVLEVTTLEKLAVHRADAPAGQVVDVPTAKRILERGTDCLKVHSVSRGESLWSIAAANSITVSDLRRANPQLGDSDLLRIGQELNLVVSDPYVNLASVEEFTYVSYLPFSEEVRHDPALWPWESYVERPTDARKSRSRLSD